MRNVWFSPNWGCMYKLILIFLRLLHRGLWKWFDDLLYWYLFRINSQNSKLLQMNWLEIKRRLFKSTAFEYAFENIVTNFMVNCHFFIFLHCNKAKELTLYLLICTIYGLEHMNEFINPYFFVNMTALSNSVLSKTYCIIFPLWSFALIVC
jgi:hypothetical protein